jgi:hypothetical protein
VIELIKVTKPDWGKEFPGSRKVLMDVDPDKPLKY